MNSIEEQYTKLKRLREYYEDDLLIRLKKGKLGIDNPADKDKCIEEVANHFVEAMKLLSAFRLSALTMEKRIEILEDCNN